MASLLLEIIIKLILRLNLWFAHKLKESNVKKHLYEITDSDNKLCRHSFCSNGIHD